MKADLVVNTPYGTFGRKTYKAYKIVSVWTEPTTGEYVAAWHVSIDNVEKHEFAGKYQLMGVYKVQYLKVDGDTPARQLPYIV